MLVINIQEYFFSIIRNTFGAFCAKNIVAAYSLFIILCVYLCIVMSKTKKAECPICKGTGQFELPARMEVDSAEIKKQMAIELHKKGYSIRQIQKALGYKSPRSIQIILNVKS